MKEITARVSVCLVSPMPVTHYAPSKSDVHVKSADCTFWKKKHEVRCRRVKRRQSFQAWYKRLALVDDDDVSEMMLGLVRRDLSELWIFREICELQVLTWSLCVSFCCRLHESLRPSVGRGEYTHRVWQLEFAKVCALSSLHYIILETTSSFRYSLVTVHTIFIIYNIWVII